MKTIKTGIKFLGIQFGVKRMLPEDLKELNQKQYIAIIRYMTGQITEKRLIATVLNIPYLIAYLLYNSYSQYKLIEAIEQVVNIKMSCDRFLINKIDKITNNVLIWETSFEIEKEKSWILNNTGFKFYSTLRKTFSNNQIHELVIFYK